ncbi:uncharacterized protein [Littorina saxatilis]|uniref:Uncharacterized protein n=1 Tax=Littorina saxatilis TaxID=31220 RepID=A0AAN9BNT6_9CAEN
MSIVFPSLITLAPSARALVVGGTGIVGSGVVRSMLKQGATVMVATRSEERFEQLRKTIPEHFHSSLGCVVGDVMTDEGARDLFEKSVKHCRGIQHVVASLRGNQTWWKAGRLIDQPLSQFYEITKYDVTGHFLLMKNFLPYLENSIGSTYTVLTGYPGSGNTAPGTSSSLLSLAAGSLHGLMDAARDEYKHSKVAVSEFNIKCLVHSQDDIGICGRGSQHLGNDLIGSAVTAVVASRAREKILVADRADVKKWVKTKSHGVHPMEIGAPPPPAPMPQPPEKPREPMFPHPQHPHM